MDRSRVRRVPSAVGAGAAGAATVIGAKLSTAGSYLTFMAFCLLATSSFLYLELYAAFVPTARPPPSWIECGPG